MAVYGLVAGEASKKIAETFVQGGVGVSFERTWDTIDELVDSIMKTAGNALASFDSILVLDYAFVDNLDTDGIAENIVMLENVMMMNGLHELNNGVKLYYITKLSDVYKALKGTVNGLPGNYYPQTHILTVRNSKVQVDFIKEVLEGRHDLEGIFNKESNLPKRLDEKYLEEGRKILEESKMFDESLLQTGDNMRVSDLRDVDFSDSRKSRERIQQEDNERRRKEKEIELAKRRGTYKEDAPKEDNEDFTVGFGVSRNKRSESVVNKSTTIVDPVTIPQPEGKIITGDRADVVVRKEYTANEKKLISAYSMLKIRSKDIPNQKLETDRGAISFIGERNSGVSGLVAQTAELYASFGRKVLVLDLDVSTRSQTVYFPLYDELASKKLSSVGLVRAVQGVDLKKTVVSMTRNIDLLSISRNDNVPENFTRSVGGSLIKLLRKAKATYDIVLLDIPLDFMMEYLRGLREADRNVFVVKNTEYYIENLFALTLDASLEYNEREMTSLIRKSSIILNQFRRGMRDVSGYEITTPYLKNILNNAGSPFDTMLISGEIPYYDDWEVQFSTNLRYIWKDVYESTLVLPIYKSVISRILI